MFKASIALVLIAFGALAYGWIAGNDAVLYGSIGASALAGLALLRSTIQDRRSTEYPPPAAPQKRPAREARSRGRDAERPEAGTRRGPKVPAGDRGGRRLERDEMTRQLDLEPGEDDIFEAEPISPARGPRRREILPPPPAGAEWGDEPEPGLDEADYDADNDAEAHAGAGLPERDYQEEPRPAAPAAAEGVAAADDFRSRLAAVLGPQGEGRPAASQPAQEQAPAPAPETEEESPDSRIRARRVTAPETDEEAPAPRTRARRVTAPETDDEAPAPKRGRRKASPARPEPEPEPEAGEEAESDRAGGLRITGVTQPGGGFARPDLPQGITPYRPRRPGVPHDEPPAAPPAPKRRRPPAERTAESKVKSVGVKRAPGRPSVTRVSGSPADDPDQAAPRRRGRPPKPKP